MWFDVSVLIFGQLFENCLMVKGYDNEMSWDILILLKFKVMGHPWKSRAGQLGDLRGGNPWGILETSRMPRAGQLGGLRGENPWEILETSRMSRAGQLGGLRGGNP